MARIRQKSRNKSRDESCGNPSFIFKSIGFFCMFQLLRLPRATHLVHRNAAAEEAVSLPSTPPPAVEEETRAFKAHSALTPVVEQKRGTEILWWQKEKPLLKDWPYLPERRHILPWLEKLKFTKGIEVGVQRGFLARRTLSVWKSCKEYKLVDLWGADPNYKQPGRDTIAHHHAHLRKAQNILKPYTDRSITEFFVMRSVDAAPLFQDSYYDYVYLDARHDYCAVKEDIDAYWPKLRPGGILAGHDFIDAPSAVAALGPNKDWSHCEDGTLEPRAVKGAVEDFAASEGLDIVTTHEGFDTWLMQKPYDYKDSTA
ncbi:expressed unknown protein [Seminavis robusta]|uniref:Methyltransferase n=1 Tax=Seminavis robusta TaxID=568900 RepID=A0A9N8DW80_9STRA|nr:expressed unknown protein [Seminavis robusta]|eukprot:Sro293_g110030.1 n/a (314) ;mRNA; f:62403-63344